MSQAWTGNAELWEISTLNPNPDLDFKSDLLFSNGPNLHSEIKLSHTMEMFRSQSNDHGEDW